MCSSVDLEALRLIFTVTLCELVGDIGDWLARASVTGGFVVFITAKASQRELEELRKLGAVGTISKPFSPTDLPEQLRAIWRALP